MFHVKHFCPILPQFLTKPRTFGGSRVRKIRETFVLWPVYGGSARRRAGQAGLEKPPDEFRLAVRSGLGENTVQVGARRGLGDLELGRGCEKSGATDDLGENAGFRAGQPEACRKIADAGQEVRAGIDE